MAKTTTVYLMADTRVEYDTQGGQRIDVTLPKGTKLEVPTTWIYNGVPEEMISANRFKGARDVR